jgi:hypothetical protein
MKPKERSLSGELGVLGWVFSMEEKRRVKKEVVPHGA